jgi:hypothetical protein
MAVGEVEVAEGLPERTDLAIYFALGSECGRQRRALPGIQAIYVTVRVLVPTAAPKQC